MIARARGAPYIALPIFVMRRFHHSGFVVRPRLRHQGAEGSRRQEGRRARLFGDDRRVDARHLRQRIRPRFLQGHLGGRRRGARRALELPPNVVHAPPGKSLAGMMAAGELQAGFTANAGIGRAGPPMGGWDKTARPPARHLSGTHPECGRGGSRMVQAHRHLSDPRPDRRQGRGAGRPSLACARAIYDGVLRRARTLCRLDPARRGRHRRRQEVSRPRPRSSAIRCPTASTPTAPASTP